jgi:hypothetical protein
VIWHTQVTGEESPAPLLRAKQLCDVQFDYGIAAEAEGAYGTILIEAVHELKRIPEGKYYGLEAEGIAYVLDAELCVER